MAHVSLSKKSKIASLLSLLLVVSSFSFLIAQADATGQLSSASVLLSDGRPNQNSVTYTIGFKWATAQTVKCVRVKYVTTAAGSTEPTGMDTRSATKGTVSGTGLTNGSWTLNKTTDGAPQFENASGDTVSAGNTATFPMSNITNPDAGVYYAQITTYSDVCTTAVDTITVAWATTAGITASVTVDPSLSFSVNSVGTSQTVNTDTTTVTTTSTTIPFGTVAGNAVAIAAHDLTVSTNAAGGYTVYASYSGQLRDGASHTIADHTGTNASPTVLTASTTTSKFGYTTEANQLSGTAARFQTGGTADYAAFTLTGAEIAGNAASAGPTASTTTRVGYKVAISNVQSPGTYTTTVGLVATPTY